MLNVIDDMELGDQLSLLQMEVACHLVTGPVYLAGETLTCQVSVVNNAATSQVFSHLAGCWAYC